MDEIYVDISCPEVRAPGFDEGGRPRAGGWRDDGLTAGQPENGESEDVVEVVDSQSDCLCACW